MQRFLLSAILLTASSAATANTCLEEKHADFTDASIGWYQALNKILVSKHPDMAESAERYLTIQTITARETQLAVKYLLDSSPKLVETDKPLSQWIDFNSELKATMQSSNTEFAGLHSQLAELKKGMGTKVDYPLRSAMAEMFTNGDSTQTAYEAYLAKVAKIEAVSCD